MTMPVLDDLAVTQYGLRHPHNVLQQMARHVANGGFWTADQLSRCHPMLSLPRPTQLIELALTEDGTCFLHDGHHRCVATFLGGRTYLRPDEYVLHERTYAWYLEPNPKSSYYLAFDPRIHVRSADFRSFQREAQVRFQADPVAAEMWRRAHVDGYRRNRGPRTVPEFAKAISRRHEVETEAFRTHGAA